MAAFFDILSIKLTLGHKGEQQRSEADDSWAKRMLVPALFGATHAVVQQPAEDACLASDDANHRKGRQNHIAETRVNRVACARGGQPIPDHCIQVELEDAIDASVGVKQCQSQGPHQAEPARKHPR